MQLCCRPWLIPANAGLQGAAAWTLSAPTLEQTWWCEANQPSGYSRVLREVAQAVLVSFARSIDLLICGVLPMATLRPSLHHCHGRTAFMMCLLSCAITLASSSVTRAQSTDEVHVVQDNQHYRGLAEADTLPVAGAPVLDIHTKPLRTDVSLVVVPVTVTDAINHPVTGLRREDFSIYEQGQPQTIRYFSDEDTPISVGLILDFSKSMTDKTETERAAVTQFFQNANREDDYSVITISDRPNLIATSTQSIDVIQSKLGLTVPDGRTALLDGIYLGAAQMRSALFPRRALLIISDGGENNSHYSLKEIKAILQESDIAVYAIGLFDTALFKTFEEYMGKKWLEEITDATSGRTLTVDNLANLPAVAANISWELRNQYVLAYKPQNPTADGKWRKIRVRVAAPHGGPPLRAHYKRTYLVPEK